MLRLIKIVSFVFFWMLLHIGTAKSKGDIQLVLIGIVVDEYQLPIEDVVVQLKDVTTDQVIQFSTEAGGNFFFQLFPDKQYALNLLNSKGKQIESKTISTLNRLEPEVLHTIFEGYRTQLRR
ncbi:MAG: hypothetical protein ACPGXL_03050 [Chitinophagales bacterium]